MIASEEDLDDRQAPVFVRKCPSCGTTVITDDGCGCSFDPKNLDLTGRKVLFVMQRMSKDTWMTAAEIADLCSLPRRSVEMILKYHSRRPKVIWSGSSIKILCHKDRYWLSRELSEVEKIHRQTVQDMMSYVKRKRPRAKGAGRLPVR